MAGRKWGSLDSSVRERILKHLTEPVTLTKLQESTESPENRKNATAPPAVSRAALARHLIQLHDEGELFYVGQDGYKIRDRGRGTQYVLKEYYEKPIAELRRRKTKLIDELKAILVDEFKGLNVEKIIKKVENILEYSIQSAEEARRVEEQTKSNWTKRMKGGNIEAMQKLRLENRNLINKLAVVSNRNIEVLSENIKLREQQPAS